MTARILPFPSRGFARQHRDRRRQSAPPARHIIKVVGFNRAGRQNEDALFRGTIRIAKPLLIAPDCAHGALKLFRQPELGPALRLAPFSKFHRASAQSPRSLPKWLYRTLAMWQYANMAIGQIVYIRAVANDDEAPNRIQELIDAAGISQAELARRANTTVSALNKVIKGTRGLDQEWMRRLAPHLGVSPAELLPMEDNPMILDEAERDLIRRYRIADKNTQTQLQRVTAAIMPSRDRESDAA